MLKLIKNKYFIGYLVIYIAVLIIVVVKKIFPVEEIISLFLIIGVIFSTLGYFLSRNSTPIFSDKQIQKKESFLVIGLIIYFTLFVTFYNKLLALMLPAEIYANEQFHELITSAAKLMFMVLIPIIIYKLLYQFKLYDWGIKANLKKIFTVKSLIIFFVFSLIMVLFQYIAGNGAKPIREGLFSERQLLIGLPLSFIVLLINVGLVEEFFFRSLLQSRLSVITKSSIGGIVVSALIFGLAHAPGIYLRGAGVIANLGAEPSLLISIGYSILALSIAGIFLSIIWLKTKNIWLIIGIHAMVDLLPNLPEFIETWGI